MILERSFEMFCREGMEVVNARSVAKALNCSTQPIFSYYTGMEDLKTTLEEKAKTTLEEALKFDAGHQSPLVNACVAVVSFAAQQPCLFRHLFARGKEAKACLFMSGEELEQIRKDEAAAYGLSDEAAAKALSHMSIYAHGYASLLSGGQMTATQDEIIRRLDAAHEILLKALTQA